jgi:hypothetical protein
MHEEEKENNTTTIPPAAAVAILLCASHHLFVLLFPVWLLLLRDFIPREHFLFPPSSLLTSFPHFSLFLACLFGDVRGR